MHGDSSPISDPSPVLSPPALTPDGPDDAVNEWLPLVYFELRKMAARYLHRERRGHTLQPTALVHEAYLRLVRQTGIQWHDKTHFIALAATTMRRVLVEHARRRGADKRGGDAHRVPLELVLGENPNESFDILALDEALEHLEAHDSVKRQVVELRYFGGLTIEETAAVLKMSTGTVKRHWTSARAWLFRALSTDGG